MLTTALYSVFGYDLTSMVLRVSIVVVCDRLDENLVSSFSPCSRDMPKFLSELRVASGTISMRNFLEKKR